MGKGPLPGVNCVERWSLAFSRFFSVTGASSDVPVGRQFTEASAAGGRRRRLPWHPASGAACSMTSAGLPSAAASVAAARGGLFDDFGRLAVGVVGGGGGGGLGRLGRDQPILLALLPPLLGGRPLRLGWPSPRLASQYGPPVPPSGRPSPSGRPARSPTSRRRRGSPRPPAARPTRGPRPRSTNRPPPPARSARRAPRGS